MGSSARIIRKLSTSAALGLVSLCGPCLAAQVDIAGPVGSVAFGTRVATLPNGNFVVTDAGAPPSSAGAVYLYAPSGALLSKISGSSANDQVSSGGITVLTNGNFLVSSPNWDNGSTVDVGALTWVNGSTGLNGAVSPANSLIGSTSGDFGVSSATTALANGHYVLRTPSWDNGTTANVGAVTWGNGNTGLVGAISPANALVGTTANDFVGGGGATTLGNGNYVVGSPRWNNGTTVDVGAATFVNGSAPLSAVVSPANSLIGTTTNDRVGEGVAALTNGNYVVCSFLWNNGIAPFAGAATWVNAAVGTTGIVSQANSLVGTRVADGVCSQGVRALPNGHYVVGSSGWDNGATPDVGAATWGNGTTGITGLVSPSNSLIGASAGDAVAESVIVLSNGNYVVRSPSWDNPPTADLGAVTWANGATGLVGLVSQGNSLVGSIAGDSVGSSVVAALSNGNYVVASPLFDNGFIANVGAVTWGNGATGLVGNVGSGNSLLGSVTSDSVGNSGIAALSNGHYIIASSSWDGPAGADLGALTWVDGSAPRTGGISVTNSLVGANATDRIGDGGVTPTPDGFFVARSTLRDNGTIVDGGAVTVERGATVITGTVTSENSVFGTVASAGNTMVFAYDPGGDRLVVGRPASNLVTLLAQELIFADSFE